MSEIQDSRVGVGMALKPPSHKIFYLNAKSADVYLHYMQNEMQRLHLDLHNFEGVFLYWVNSIVSTSDNYSDGGSRSVVLFIENLDKRGRVLQI